MAAKPTKLFWAVGMVMDPPVSDPRPTVQNHADMDTPVPELDEPGNLAAL